MIPFRKNNNYFHSKNNKYKSFFILLLFILIMIIIYQSICYIDNVIISDPYYQPLSINLSKESIMRLLPEQKIVVIPPFQSLLNQ